MITTKNVIDAVTASYAVVVLGFAASGIAFQRGTPLTQFITGATGVAPMAAAVHAAVDTIAHPDKKFYETIKPVDMDTPSSLTGDVALRPLLTLVYGTYNTGMVRHPDGSKTAPKPKDQGNWAKLANDPLFEAAYEELVLAENASYTMLDDVHETDSGLSAAAYRENATGKIILVTNGIESDNIVRDPWIDYQQLLYAGMNKQIPRLDTFYNQVTQKFGKIDLMVNQSMGCIPGTAVAFAHNTPVLNIESRWNGTLQREVWLQAQALRQQYFPKESFDKQDLNAFEIFYKTKTTNLVVGANTYTTGRTAWETPAIFPDRTLLFKDNGQVKKGWPVLGMNFIGGDTAHPASVFVRGGAVEKPSAAKQLITVEQAKPESMPNNDAEMLRARGEGNPLETLLTAALAVLAAGSLVRGSTLLAQSTAKTLAGLTEILQR